MLSSIDPLVGLQVCLNIGFVRMSVIMSSMRRYPLEEEFDIDVPGVLRRVYSCYPGGWWPR